MTRDEFHKKHKEFCRDVCGFDHKPWQELYPEDVMDSQELQLVALFNFIDTVVKVRKANEDD